MIAPIMILSDKRESPVSVLAVASSVTKRLARILVIILVNLYFLRPNKSTCSSEPITNAKDVYKRKGHGFYHDRGPDRNC